MSYFTPLRRMLGVVTLLLACGFAVGWVRSSQINDTIIVLAGRTWLLNFLSNKWGLGARAAAYGNDNPGFKFNWYSEPVSSKDPSRPMENVSVPFRLEVGGFHFGCKGINVFDEMYFAVCFVPYSYIVIPLTLLSAWLLLNKLRAGKIEVAESPIPTES